MTLTIKDVGFSRETIWDLDHCLVRHLKIKSTSFENKALILPYKHSTIQAVSHVTSIPVGHTCGTDHGLEGYAAILNYPSDKQCCN